MKCVEEQEENGKMRPGLGKMKLFEEVFLRTHWTIKIWQVSVETSPEFSRTSL